MNLNNPLVKMALIALLNKAAKGKGGDIAGFLQALNMEKLDGTIKLVKAANKKNWQDALAALIELGVKPPDVLL